jgi:hypothetical protein
MKILSRCSIRLINKITTISKKQAVLNFITAHPRLTAILAGLGISIVFSSFGRFFVHEALATATTAVAPTSLPDTLTTTATVQSADLRIDYIDKTPIYNVPGHVTNVAFFCSCQECGAKEFAPGQEAISPGDAQNVAPGELAKSPGDASNFAPGQQLKK